MTEFRMNKEMMQAGLHELGKLLLSSDRCVDVGVYGGSALVLTSNFRESTGDVDAKAIHFEDEKILATAAREVCQRRQWPEDWFNDGVKAFISPKVDYYEGLDYAASYPSEDKAGLRTFVPNPIYLLSMKLLSSRIPEDIEEKTDLPDIVNLMLMVKPESKADLVDMGAAYYPELRTSGKLHWHLNDIWTAYEKALRDGVGRTPEYPARSSPAA